MIEIPDADTLDDLLVAHGATLHHTTVERIINALQHLEDKQPDYCYCEPPNPPTRVTRHT